MPSAFEDMKASATRWATARTVAKDGAWQQLHHRAGKDQGSTSRGRQERGITWGSPDPDTACNLISNSLDVLRQVPPGAAANTVQPGRPLLPTSPTPASNHRRSGVQDDWKARPASCAAACMSINREDSQGNLRRDAPARRQLTAPTMRAQEDLPRLGERRVGAQGPGALGQGRSASPTNSPKLTIAYNADAAGAPRSGLTRSPAGSTTWASRWRASPLAFKELRTDAKAGKLTGAARSGWQADYPSCTTSWAPPSPARPPTTPLRRPGVRGQAERGSRGQSTTVRRPGGRSMLLEDLPSIPLWLRPGRRRVVRERLGRGRRLGRRSQYCRVENRELIF
ncbi:hypothetical protein QJS66_12025 [Kocuria rhizophila]|nr:hypothetical protein QJS66_12025 [Kocuria rhizophila]